MPVQQSYDPSAWNYNPLWINPPTPTQPGGGATDPTSIYNLWNYYQQIAQQQYQWGQQQFAQNSALTDQVVNDFLGKSRTLTGMGTSDLARYQGIFQPVENQLVADAASYAGAPRIAAEMGRAGATAAQAAEKGRQNALADLQAHGIDPSSGRYAALDNAERLQAAASVAGAQNTAREQAEATGRGLRSEAIQVGERYPGQIATELGGALTADAQAVQAKLANAASGVNLMGSPTQWGGLTDQAASIYANRQNALTRGGGGSSVNWPNQGKPGEYQDRINTGGGGGGGAGGSYPGGMSSQWSTPSGDFTPVDTGGGDSGYTDPGSYSDQGDMGGSYDTAGGDYGDYGDYGGDTYAQSGGAIDTGMPPPQPMGPTTGGIVPPSASPSAGAIQDDVPSRLSAHEYVIPRDVALWQGRKFYQHHIDKARQEMAGATAKPKMKPALNQRPTFRSRPMMPPPRPAIPGAI